MRRPRIALAAAAACLAVTASGCSYFNPVQTHEFYQSADGTNVSITAENGELFEVGVRNAIVLVDDAGNGELIGSVVNYTGESRSVQIEGTYEGSSVFSSTINLESQEVVKLGPAELHGEQDSSAVEGTAPGEETSTERIEVSTPQFPVATGSTMELTIDADGRSETVTLPVTGTQLPYFGSGEDA